VPRCRSELKRTPSSVDDHLDKEDPLPPQLPSHAPRTLANSESANLSDPDLREAVLRICELSDVNPPSRRARRMLAFSGVATLWVEAALLLVVPVGLA
jgi:hypothetical protein